MKPSHFLKTGNVFTVRNRKFRCNDRSNVIITPALAWRIGSTTGQILPTPPPYKIYSSRRYGDWSLRMADLIWLIGGVSEQMYAHCSQMPHKHCCILSNSLRVNLTISDSSVSGWIAVFNASFKQFCLGSNVVMLGNHRTHKCLMW